MKVHSAVLNQVHENDSIQNLLQHLHMPDYCGYEVLKVYFSMFFHFEEVTDDQDICIFP